MSPYTSKKVLQCIFVFAIYATFGNALAKNLPIKESVQNVGVSSDNKPLSWLQHMKLLRSEIKDCVKRTKDSTWNCCKMSSLRIFDDVMSAAVVPLWEGIRFVRMENSSAATPVKQSVAYAVGEYATKHNTEAYQRQDLQHLTWFDRLAMSLANTLNTHVLQVNLKQLTSAYMRAMDTQERSQSNRTDPIGTARMRRHRYNMIITMMFGVTALGAVLVPMGFQLLSVVSGKALLLAKMALLLASINGLKRVANSGVHYGLYHVPGEPVPYTGGYYDRGDVQHPRNVANLAVAQPLDFGIRK